MSGILFYDTAYLFGSDFEAGIENWDGRDRFLAGALSDAEGIGLVFVCDKLRGGCWIVLEE